VLTESYLNGKPDYVEPLFLNGIEAYLSEPLNGTDALLSDLLSLLQMCKHLEGIRETWGTPTMIVAEAKKKVWPNLLRLAEQALRYANSCLPFVDVTLEKMKPIS
jgi:hypothetical protein